MEGSGSTPGDADPGVSPSPNVIYLDDDEDYSNEPDDGLIVDATTKINELLVDSSKEHSIPPPLMHGFLGGYIAGVASIILLLIIVALVVYILRKRRRRDYEIPDVPELPPGVHQEYNQGPREVKGVLKEGGTVTEGRGACGNVCDEHQYMHTYEVRIVSALPPGVYQEYNQGPREVQGVLKERGTVAEGGGAGGNVCDEHHYMEVKPDGHN